MRLSQSFVFSAAGAFLFIGHMAYRWVEPLRDNVPAFLVIYSLLFAVYFSLVYWFKTEFPSAFKDNNRIFAGMVLFAGLFRLTLSTQTPTLSDDIYRYVWDGRVQQSGLNPYFYPPSASELNFLKDENHRLINHPTIRTVYPPLSQWIFRLGFKIHPTLFGQKILFLIFDFAVIFLLAWYLSIRSLPPLWSFIYAWNPLCVLEFSGSGHNDSLMLCALLLSFILFEKNKVASGYMALGAATMTKLIPLIMIPWLFFQKNRRFLVLYGLVIGVLCFSFAQNAYQLWTVKGWASSGIGVYAKDWVFNSSLYGVMGCFIPDPSFRKIVIGICLILFSFLWVQKSFRDPFLYAFGIIFALLLASPVVHPWYVTWMVPFLCVYRLWSGLLWTWLVGFTYIVLIRYTRDGVWSLSPVVMVGEYAVLYGVLLFEILRGWKQRGMGKVWTSVPSSNFIQKRTLKVTVIIPALNEEKAIKQVIKEIPKDLVQDVIVVDNGSTDGTVAAALEGGARVVQEPRRGYGQAVLTGLTQLKSVCDTVVILDGDHSDFPEDLPQLLNPISSLQADMAIGTRTQAALPGSLMPQQRFGNWLTCLFIKILYGEKFSDMGPFRAIRREVLENMQMEDRNFGWNVEMQVKALQKGLSIAEVPVRYRPRIGKSKISGTINGSLKAGIIILWSIYHYAWRRS